jgi:hypothetical protein
MIAITDLQPALLFNFSAKIRVDEDKAQSGISVRSVVTRVSQLQLSVESKIDYIIEYFNQCTPLLRRKDGISDSVGLF